ncbi:MAG: hypothetical protein WC162_04275 [Sphaerochaetaceae bacterium]
MTKKRLSFLFILFSCFVLFAGPFNINMGDSEQDLIDKKINFTVYSETDSEKIIDFIPNEQDNVFDDYFLYLDKQSGVYSVTEISKLISCSSGGKELYQVYNLLSTILDKAFETSSKSYVFQSSSINSEEKTMENLLSEDLVVLNYWKVDNLNNDIKSITLEMRAETEDMGFLVLNYYGYDILDY